MNRRAPSCLPVVLCFFALRAGADPIVKVEYWGTVQALPNPRDNPNIAVDEYSVGDRIHGTVLIDTALAPPARHYVYPTQSFTVYTWLPDECDASVCPPLIYGPSGFVTDDRAPPGVLGMSNDYVKLNDGTLTDGFDSFEVVNWETHELGGAPPNDFDQHKLDVGIGGTMDFLHGDGLLQQFDVRAQVGGIDGTLQELLNGVQRLVYFSVDRLRATQMVCPAT